MKDSPGRTRKPSKLSKSVNRHLHAYATAAGAAGVAMLALSQPADAKVVHTVVNATIGGPEFQGSTSYDLDLNNAGTVDFTINFSFIDSDGLFLLNLRVDPAQSQNAVWAVSCGGGPCADDVPGNTVIDSNRHLKTSLS